MISTWDHPELGRFKYDGAFWTRIVDVPAFKAFAYDTGFGKGPSKGKHKLEFMAYDETDLPSTAAIALALKVLANQAELVATVAQALWDDFSGRGPDSGMWWHGDLEQVAEAMYPEEPPTAPDDLLAVMQVSRITVHKGVHGDDKPIVELSFRAAFEQEHGVGVLSDGQAVLGFGYSGEATPFEPWD
jgi:hypothetical protein